MPMTYYPGADEPPEAPRPIRDAEAAANWRRAMALAATMNNAEDEVATREEEAYEPENTHRVGGRTR